MDKKDGLRLACRFSLITNRLRYCGPKDAYKDFYIFLKGKRYDENKIREHFMKYEGLYVYLDYIGKKLKKEPLDYEVVEAYWLGNESLDKFTKEDLKNIILELTNRGLPRNYADNLANRLPDGMNLSHSFNVLFIGVGMTTHSVPTNIRTMNKCIVSIGRVLKIRDRDLTVNLRPIIIRGKRLLFSEPEFQYIEYEKELFPNLKINDKVAVHWDFACKILSKEEENNLNKYNQRNIDALNRALEKS